MTRLLNPEGLLLHLTGRAYAQLLRSGQRPGRCLRLAVEAAERSLARIERRRRRRPTVKPVASAAIRLTLGASPTYLEK